MKIFLRKSHRVLPLLVLLLIATVAYSQQAVFREGVKQGSVKVKFAATMTSSLHTMRVVQSGGELITGIASFDAVAKQTTATNMRRLFPYNEKNESKLKKHGLHLWFVVDVSDDANPEEVAAIYQALGEVELAEVTRQKVLDPYTMTAYTPSASTNAANPFNDPMLPDQWHYQNDRTGEFSGSDANVFEAWETITGAGDVIVAVHDEGADVNHEDLAANMWVNQIEMDGEAGVDDDNNGYIDDIHGFNFDKGQGEIDPQNHATHVSGTIAAVNNNGIGVAGVAGGDDINEGAKIMSLQVMGGGSIENSYIYAADNGAVISQNSWGYYSSNFYEQSVLDAIDYFIAEAGNYPGSPMTGGIVIFASGNSNSNGKYWPGYYDAVLSVASTGPAGARASYSNYGSWVDISAPGGDFAGGTENAILSLAPNNSYAWLQGTSMACPHVSGIAALVIANNDGEITADELWNKLVTGVSDVYTNNPDYIGEMGAGSIDAAMAIENDEGIAPDQITDLAVTGVAQEFATLAWTVPSDTDDNLPVAFNIYYSTEIIDASNVISSTKEVVTNDLALGDTFDFEVNDLFGLTEYFFVVTAIDRWGNESTISNNASTTTNAGPSMRIDDNSLFITLDYDAVTGAIPNHDITLFNDADGLLRWNHEMRHKTTSISWSGAGLSYPVANEASLSTGLRTQSADGIEKPIKKAASEVVPSAYTRKDLNYTTYASMVIGETDTTFTNSSATRFYVEDADGFNLTDVTAWTYHDPATGPMIVEFYRGETLEKENLVFAQEQLGWGYSGTWSYVKLQEQLFFEQGETFWVVYHVPSGNLFPLGVGREREEDDSDNCMMSLTMGATWEPLGVAMGDHNYAWTTAALSYNAYLGEYLVLTPGNGEVAGLDNGLTTLTGDGSTLINGTYGANVLITSNDGDNQEVRLPVVLNVTGHRPELAMDKTVDFGAVFQGTEKVITFTIDNVGLGRFNNPMVTINDPQFTTSWLGSMTAQESYTFDITFSPTGISTVNDVLTISDGIDTYSIGLFGIGMDTPELTVTPLSQTVNGITIGDVVNAQVTVENTGDYPLQYFIPGFDDQGISEDWPNEYHKYGYQVVTNDAAETTPIAYDFIDISATGTEISDIFKLNTRNWATVPLGFDFPYYNNDFDTLYAAWGGFMAFDNSISAINSPTVANNQWIPRGYLSPYGNFIQWSLGGTAHYEVLPDRVVIQYTDVKDQEWSMTSTFQIQLFPNGNIRVYYQTMGSNEQWMNVMINSYDRDDAQMYTGWSKNAELGTSIVTGTAFGFDYPGPDIITSVSNGSGILAPGATSTVDITLSTDILVEGTTNRYLNFVNNNPNNAQANALISLEIVAGGTPVANVSIDTVRFGDVFQNGMAKAPFVVKNNGTANVDISSATWVNGEFTLNGTQPVSIVPGIYAEYSIEMNTTALASFEDWLSINYADGTYDTIYVTGTVVDPPAIDIDLTLLQETLAYGDSSVYPLTIENTGLADLEVVAVGKQWLTFKETVGGTSMQESAYTYAYEEYNDGTNYGWIDITETGTKIEIDLELDPFAKEGYWTPLTLPRAMSVYGNDYTDIHIGENGVLAFDAYDDLPDQMRFPASGLALPHEDFQGTFLFPYWTFSSPGNPWAPEGKDGMFYEFREDKMIISWNYFTNWFGGMGDAVSAQVIIYDNGTYKYQYRVEETDGWTGANDLTSKNSVMGAQSTSLNDAVIISSGADVVHGDGLAYILTPAEKHVITPGSTLVGEILLDAGNIYGGVYTNDLVINTNVPGSESLVKPIELTVTGTAVYVAVDSVDFGTMVVKVDQWGNPSFPYPEMDITIGNEGAAAMDITYMERATPLAWPDVVQTTLQLYKECPPNDPWCWGGWTDIEGIFSPWGIPPTYTVNPEQTLDVKVVFKATQPGIIRDTIMVTTSVGMEMIIIKANAILPPSANVDITPIDVVMNDMGATQNESIAFDNLAGNSDLTYSVSVDYGRETSTSSNANESMAVSGASGQLTGIDATNVNAGVGVSASYNRTIQYGTETLPTTHIGTGGESAFSVSTLFNTGSTGFLISHVESWFRVESVLDATVTIEIRAGGTSIADASIVGTGSITLSESSSDDNGSWRAIALDAPVQLYPGEDFYVVVTYPFGIQFPQGTVENYETAPGRYMYLSNGMWSDLQDAGFPDAQWLMYAAEETAGAAEWLTITSLEAGVLAAGEASTINLTMVGAAAQRGNQIAEVVFTSDDPDQAEYRIPVSLHMNEAPTYTGVEMGYIIAEMDTLKVVADISDIEGNTFTVTPNGSYAGLTYTLTGNEFAVDYSPIYGDEGSYVFTFDMTDEYDATSVLTLNVEVAKTNQAPAFNDPSMVFQYATLDSYNEYMFADYFTDPDGDAMIFAIESGDDLVAEAFEAGDKFVIKTTGIGTGFVTLTATDVFGATVSQQVTVDVSYVLGVESSFKKSLNVFPVPARDYLNILLGDTQSNEVRLINTNGQVIQTIKLNEFQSEVKLNTSNIPNGIYIVQLVGPQGVFTKRIIKE